MSKQIIYNQEKKALYFQNNDIYYRLDLTEYKQSQVEFNSRFEFVDRLEQNLISIYSDIDRIEKKLKIINRAINKININLDNGKISFIISFEIKEYELISDEYGHFSLALALEKISFNEIATNYHPGFYFIDINSADINEINTFSQFLFSKIQNNYKNFGYILKLDKMSFHRPSENTIESF